MITVQTDYGRVQVDYVDGMTVTQAMQATLDEGQLELREASWQMQETKTGRFLSPDEEIVDNRYYILISFLKMRPNVRRV